jgi:hypothetical protein
VVGFVIAAEFFTVVGLIIESGARLGALCGLTGQVPREIEITKNMKGFGNVGQTENCRLIGVKTTTFIS